MADKENEQNLVDESTGQAEFDTAGKSLMDALGISFVALKVIMAALVLLFLVSGIFRVQEDEQAMVLRFGKIRGISEDRVLGPGLHTDLPKPISEIVKIPVTKVQTLPIDSFWYYMTEREKTTGKLNPPRDTLKPGVGGYCLTRNDSLSGAGGADYNIVHSKWELGYRIDDPEKFFRNIYYNAPGPGEDFLDVVSETVDPLLKAMASDAIVSTLVHYSIDEAIESKEGIARGVELLLQDKLDRINSGIVVTSMRVVGKITWPRQVDDAFLKSNMAKQKGRTLVEEAQGYASKTLNEAGGENSERILAALKEPGLTRDEKRELLSQLSGACREKISLAKGYKTTVVATARANADYLEALLPEYRKRPELVLQKIYQDAIEVVMANAREKIFIQPLDDELRLIIGKDRSIREKKQEKQK